MLLGAAWIMALTTFGGVAQATLPNWVARPRAGGLSDGVFNGALAGGSLALGLRWHRRSARPPALADRRCRPGCRSTGALHRPRLPHGRGRPWSRRVTGPNRRWPTRSRTIAAR
ncbi:MFS transporter [Cupriavidus basilensis]